jgi:hypothetical protein
MLWISAAALPLIGLAVGCSKTIGRPHVRGKVIVAGLPAGNQTLTLYSEGRPGEFSTQQIPIRGDGSFEGEVGARGTYKVVIEESMAAREGHPSAATNRVPEKYRKLATTDLIWDIQQDDNYREFDLRE